MDEANRARTQPSYNSLMTLYVLLSAFHAYSLMTLYAGLCAFHAYSLMTLYVVLRNLSQPPTKNQSVANAETQLTRNYPQNTRGGLGRRFLPSGASLRTPHRPSRVRYAATRP
jgi:hypothetical protein